MRTRVRMLPVLLEKHGPHVCGEARAAYGGTGGRRCLREVFLKKARLPPWWRMAAPAEMKGEHRQEKPARAAGQVHRMS